MSVLEYRSASADLDRRAGFIQVVGWAIFLGISWTWCIGMFLPVLLIRDFGNISWIIFATPNVIGAAAMGWLITSDRSRAMVASHFRMIEIFGTVTAAFQLFFVAWMAIMFAGRAAWSILIPFLFVIEVIRRSITLDLRVVATGALIASVCFMMQFTVFFRPNIGNLLVGMDHPLQLSGLTVACLFGFAFCPYLDPTFHRVCQSMAPRDVRWAFSIGFGIVFLGMIVFTLLYAATVNADVLHSRPGDMPLDRVLTLMPHWLAQTLVTIVFQLLGVGSIFARRRSSKCLFVALSIAALGVVVAATFNRLAVGGEFVYRIFISFYGLVAPAYVWLCVIPTNGVATPSQRMWLVAAIAVVVAMPFYWLAFIDNRMPFALIGVAIVLAARLFVGSPQNRVLV